jgi:hypothetical protein
LTEIERGLALEDQTVLMQQGEFYVIKKGRFEHEKGI